LNGRADYFLSGQRGPLGVLEAKKEDVDPYDAKEQARGYAENLKAPFVLLSNGREHWFWNYTRSDQDAYRIERLPSLADLERLRLKNLQPPRPLMSEVITPDWLKPFRSDLTIRRYQIKAIDTLCTLFDNKRLRKFLLEMATGNGKTLLCAALIRRFLITKNAERVLFIVDRIELAKQTLEDFNVILGEFTAPCPYCKKPTLLQEDSSPAAALDRKKPPVWLAWMVAVGVASLLLTIALVAVVNWIPTLSLAALWQVYGWYMFVATFVSLCGAGLWILFLVYVFTSLTEMRVLLGEIAANTRTLHTPPRKPPEQTIPSAWPTLPKPSAPPEDAKYMPKL